MPTAKLWPVPFRLAVSADLHFDVPRSRGPAESLADRINAADVDGVLLVGDTATADGDGLERCLELFRADRPRWFVPGNHELWTKRQPRDAEYLLGDELPTRVNAAGWHWLPRRPIRIGQCALVGSLGWYDYAFAEPRLGLPRRFYEAKLSPGTARALRRVDLELEASDVPVAGRDFRARWNDGRSILGIDDDPRFLRRRLDELMSDLVAVKDAAHVAVFVHMVPLADLLPQVPTGLGSARSVAPDRLPFAFSRAYLGSPEIGKAILRFPNVREIICGHSHSTRDVEVAGRKCVNVGSNYVEKRFSVLSLPD